LGILRFIQMALPQRVSGEIEFEFKGSGWGILWRSLLAVLGAGLIIPIPWVMHWLVGWFTSQIECRPATA
jgi:hypothetical protein